jgi:hypothetical protein
MGADAKHRRNPVADFLDNADERPETDDRRLVLKEVLTDLLNEPVVTLQEKQYPDYEMRPDSWPAQMVLEHYLDAPGDLRTRDLIGDAKQPEAQAAIREWLAVLNGPNGPHPVPSGFRHNIVADYFNGATVGSEPEEGQDDVIKQALTDMLYEPVENLRNERYPADYRPDPPWTVIELLTNHFAPRPIEQTLEDGEFFRDVKAPEAQAAIRVWLDWFNLPPGLVHGQPYDHSPSDVQN